MDNHSFKLRQFLAERKGLSEAGVGNVIDMAVHDILNDKGIHWNADNSITLSYIQLRFQLMKNDIGYNTLIQEYQSWLAKQN